MNTLNGWEPRANTPREANFNTLTEERGGIMLHYDGSAKDNPGVNWVLYDPRAQGSYNWMVTDQGQLIRAVPISGRAWHAGKCRPSAGAIKAGLDYHDANSFFYGLAITATDGDRVTDEALSKVVDVCVALFLLHSWPQTKKGMARIRGHNDEAWPAGRKIDPVGSDPSKPVLHVLEVRSLTLNRLNQMATVL